MVLSRKCPCCNGKEAERILEVNFISNNNLPTKYDVVNCVKCGFSFANSDATQEDYNDYYKNYNDYADDSTVKNSDVDEESAYQIVAKKIKENISKEKYIIDLGCGEGVLLDLLKNDGYSNLKGLDPSAKAIEKVKKNGIEAVVGDVFDGVGSDDRNKYDVVVSTCVIEHIYDVHQYINVLSDYLNEDGVIFLALPASEGFAEYYVERANYFNQEHINYFSINSLDNILNQHNMERINEEVYYLYKNEKYIYAIYRVGGKNKKEIEKDFVSRFSIEQYVELEKEKAKCINEKIDSILNSSNSIVVFGTGQWIKQILSQRPELLDKIEFFIDNNKEKQKRLLAGKSIYAPQRLYQFQQLDVVICSMLNSKEMIQQLQSMKIKNKYICLKEEK